MITILVVDTAGEPLREMPVAAILTRGGVGIEPSVIHVTTWEGEIELAEGRVGDQVTVFVGDCPPHTPYPVLVSGHRSVEVCDRRQVVEVPIRLGGSVVGLLATQRRRRANSLYGTAIVARRTSTSGARRSRPSRQYLAFVHNTRFFCFPAMPVGRYDLTVVRIYGGDRRREIPCRPTEAEVKRGRVTMVEMHELVARRRRRSEA